MPLSEPKDDSRSDTVDKKQTTQEGVCRRAIKTQVECREDGDGQVTISGHASVFYDGTPGTEYELWPNTVERIMPEAFDRALKEKDDVFAFFNHDPSLVLGRTSAGTLDLSIDKRGLRYDNRPGDTTVGRDVVEHIRRGDITGSSFAMKITDETWRMENDIDIREVRGVELFDVSPVTFPAYAAADTGVREEARSSWKRWKDRFEKGREMTEHVTDLAVGAPAEAGAASDEWFRKTKEKIARDLAASAGT